MTRDEALGKLEKPGYDPETIDHDKEFIANKLGITVDELMGYHALPNKSYRDYKNQEWLFNFGAKVLKTLGIERAIKR
jgi:hypothetical protein